MPEECLCDRCTALCCRYFALQIDEPETPEQFDDIRWYLMHEAVHIFVEDGEWYLSVQSRCQNLLDDNRCGVYEDRPRVCREYTTDNCDYHVGEYDYEQYFTSAEQLEAYAQAVLGKKQAKYAVKQRAANTGHNGKSAGPDAHEVLHARVRPKIKGHPSASRKLRGHKPAAGPIELSIGGKKG